MSATSRRCRVCKKIQGSSREEELIWSNSGMVSVGRMRIRLWT